MPHTAGLRTLVAHDGATAFPVLATYPASAPERTVRLGPYEIEAAPDAPPAPGRHPLVLISHGSGGSPYTHRGLALHLARAGFVVAAPEHPRNNRDDNTLAGTAELLANRPREATAAIDAALGDGALGAAIDAGAVGGVGHSIGAYTLLALAGGRPWAGPYDTPPGPPRPVDVTPDPRLRALVLLAPATPWYMAPGALAEVRAPVLLVSGARDAMAPAWHGEIVARGVPDPARVTQRVVPNANHYAFLAPFPPAMARPGFPPAADEPGFDRAAFHRALYPEVEAFLRGALNGTDAGAL